MPPMNPATNCGELVRRLDVGGGNRGVPLEVGVARLELLLDVVGFSPIVTLMASKYW